MHMLKSRMRRWSRLATLAAVVGAAGTLAACDDFMRVTNPGAIENPALENPDYIGLMVGGVLGDFQPAFGWTALWSGVFTDELRNHHTYFENPEIDRRDVNDNNGTYQLSVYNGLHRARFLADSVASRLQVLLADSAGRDLRLARVQAYSGYAWALLGEQYCETPINRSTPVPSEELLRTAVQRFEAALQTAMAARTAAANIQNAAARSRAIAGADSIANLARVGAARAALNLAAYDPSAAETALTHALSVAPAYTSASSEGFEFYAHYTLDSDRYTRRVSNPHYEFIRSGRWFSITGTPFEGLNDPRVPHADTLYRAADGTQRTFVNAPSSFSTYTGELPGGAIMAESDIRLASALEARYIVAELVGATPANVDFINERRAIGGQLPLIAPTSAEYMAALREQRARDFYLDGHRMGDIRRYKEMYGVDLWPSGDYFGHATLDYGTQECWPVPLSEQF